MRRISRRTVDRARHHDHAYLPDFVGHDGPYNRPVTPSQPQVRLAELVATLSLCTDLGLGQPMEHVMRRCLISLRLGERLGLDEAERVVVYYTALLATVGCHVDAYEQAKWFGDDIAMKADGYLASSELGFMLSHFGAGKPPLERARLMVAFLGGGFRWLQDFLQTHCAEADFLASRLGLGDDVRASLAQSYELWNGKHDHARRDRRHEDHEHPVWPGPPPVQRASFR
jgi:hypothetical protein